MILLRTSQLDTQKAMKGRKSGSSGDFGHFTELSY
jgi:hypothetical protein